MTWRFTHTTPHITFLLMILAYDLHAHINRHAVPQTTAKDVSSKLTLALGIIPFISEHVCTHIGNSISPQAAGSGQGLGMLVGIGCAWMTSVLMHHNHPVSRRFMDSLSHNTWLAVSMAGLAALSIGYLSYKRDFKEDEARHTRGLLSMLAIGSSFRI